MLSSWGAQLRAFLASYGSATAQLHNTRDTAADVHQLVGRGSIGCEVAEDVFRQIKLCMAPGVGAVILFEHWAGEQAHGRMPEMKCLDRII